MSNQVVAIPDDLDGDILALTSRERISYADAIQQALTLYVQVHTGEPGTNITIPRRATGGRTVQITK